MEEKDYITRREHEEFSKRIASEHNRMNDENSRQNKRIDALEKITGQMNTLIISVEKMAVNMENMLAAIERQGTLIEKQNERLDDIEKGPADNYKQIKMLIITTIVGAIVGGLASQLVALL